jgi:hypothetical protein
MIGMKILKNILRTCLGLAACVWVLICMSAPMPEKTWPLTAYSYVHSSLLICSVVYLHCALRTFLVPCQGLSKEQVLNLRRAINARYAKGLLSGTIGLGYLLLILHTVAFLDRSVSERPSFLAGAMFFIVLGILAQGRAAIQYLCEVHAKEAKIID